MTTTSRESCDRVCPGLDFSEDCVVRVGRDAQPVAGEIHVVNLAVRVVAPECRGVPVKFRVMDGGPGDCQFTYVKFDKGVVTSESFTKDTKDL